MTKQISLTSLMNRIKHKLKKNSKNLVKIDRRFISVSGKYAIVDLETQAIIEDNIDIIKLGVELGVIDSAEEVEVWPITPVRVKKAPVEVVEPVVIKEVPRQGFLKPTFGMLWSHIFSLARGW